MALHIFLSNVISKSRPGVGYIEVIEIKERKQKISDETFSIISQKFDIHFMQSFISAQSVTLFMFIYCYCGNSITINCSKITYAASQSCWYRYPVKYQQFVRHIIRRGQKPFYLTGYEIAKCSFETFRSVSFFNDFK